MKRIPGETTETLYDIASNVTMSLLVYSLDPSHVIGPIQFQGGRYYSDCEHGRAGPLDGHLRKVINAIPQFGKVSSSFGHTLDKALSYWRDLVTFQGRVASQLVLYSYTVE
jgi:hypothetical protein